MNAKPTPPLNAEQKRWAAVAVLVLALGIIATVWLGDWRGVATGAVAFLVALVFTALAA